MAHIDRSPSEATLEGTLLGFMVVEGGCSWVFSVGLRDLGFWV